MCVVLVFKWWCALEILCGILYRLYNIYLSYYTKYVTGVMNQAELYDSVVRTTVLKSGLATKVNHY